MECLISINLFPLETWRKDSPLRRFSKLPQTKNKTLGSLISCFGWGRYVRGCKGGFPLSRNFYVRTGVKFTCLKQKGYDQFIRISNIAEHSRYENFALTRMFYKHCFCDSNIPSSHGWQNRNHFPRFIISNRMQRLNIQALVLQQENLRHAKSKSFCRLCNRNWTELAFFCFSQPVVRGTQLEYSSNLLKHGIVKRILVFKR